MKRLLIIPLCLPLALAWAAEEVMLKPVTVTGSGDNDVADRREAATQKIVINRADIEAMDCASTFKLFSKFLFVPSFK